MQLRRLSFFARWVACGFSGCVLTGCLVHHARVEQAPAPPQTERSDYLVGTQRIADAQPAIDRRGPLPCEIAAVLVRRDAHGGFARVDRTVATPLPWWQRFPCDLVTDLWPQDLHCQAQATLVPVPLVARAPQDLADEARAAGYASPADAPKRPGLPRASPPSPPSSPSSDPASP